MVSAARRDGTVSQPRSKSVLALTVFSQTRVIIKGGKNTSAPDHEPPAGYVCYRCGEKGHWIQACPTNDDPNFDNKPRVKRTTGIPRSFLKTVEKPVALTADGLTDDTKPPPGIMVNAEGEYVIAEPDKKSWEQFQAKTKSSDAAQKAAALGDKELQDRGLECPIDKRIFIDPMKTPCCEKTYCNDCITNALIESDFTCPGCQTDGVLIDDLKPDTETSAKITEYLAEKNAASKKERSKSPSVKPQTPPADDKVKSPSPTSPEKVKSPPAAPATAATRESKSPNPEIASASTQSQTKKRPADEILENPKIPKGPKAMQQQEAQKQAMLKQQQNMMNSMPGFPNMPFNPMMGMNGFGGVPNMNMNMMNGYGMNPMMGMPMMGMNGGMNGFGGAPMSGMMNNNMYGAQGFNGMGMMSNMGQQTNGAGVAGGFSNQQKTVFAEPLPNEEDNAYFRKPVNPHRHQGRQRRARPTDYREL
jgi:protein MPE1